MGEINLIPGQQVKGQGRAQQSGAGGVEYSHPVDEKLTPQVSGANRPPKQGWWARRQVRRAAQAAAKAAAQAVVPKAEVRVNLAPKSTKSGSPKPAGATPPPQDDFFPVEIDLLADVKKASPPPHPTSAVRPIQAEPDFISDAGFKSSSTPPAYVPPRKPLPSTNDAYYIRRPVKPVADPKPTKHKKEKHVATQGRQHQPTELPVSLMDVNLIPKEFGLATKPKHPWSELIRYGVVSGVIVGATYGGLRWYEYKLTSDTADLKAQVAVLDQQIATYATERKQAIVLQDKLTGLTTIIDEHVNYAEFFSFVEANTLPTVYYKSLNVDARSGAVSTSAVTSDFDQLRAQVAVLEDNSLVSAVTVNSATRTVPTTPTGEVSTTGVQTLLFSLTFKVDQSVFHQ